MAKILNKDLLIVSIICIIFIGLMLFLICDILDLLNPIYAEEETIKLTPQLQSLLEELEEKFK